MADYKPELGQLVFGQGSQNKVCASGLSAALTALCSIWEVTRPDTPNPFENSGCGEHSGKRFKAYAYSWSDEPQEFNFAWRDVRVSWYKYLGRGMSVNRDVSEAETRELLRECAAELLGLD